MANNSAAFGNAKTISGKAGSFKASLLPLDLLQELKPRAPIPVTLSGTLNRAFTVLASRTKPVSLVIGNDYVTLTSNLAYTWSITTANSILNSAGAITTLDGDGTALVPYYYYVGMDSSGTVTIKPSASAPSYVEGPYGSGTYAHPGTARTQPWVYVGFGINEAATAVAFSGVTKVGYVYSLDTAVAVNAPEATAAALLDFSATLPKHGVEVMGYSAASLVAAETISLAATTTSAGYLITAGTTTAITVPYGPIVVDTAGKFSANQSSTANIAVSVTQIRDVV